MKELLSIFYVFILMNSYSQTQYLVAPNTADPLSSAPNNFHFCYINSSVQQKQKLFLFFPGTGGVPFNYQKILKHAANLGYHSIGLTYSNSVAINDYCSNNLDTTCHSRARMEVFDGNDRHPDIDVDTINCIEHRTLMLLKYLNTAHPSENWDTYFTGNQVNWNRIIVSGHSQGGGFAGIISKVKTVSRVVMFAATDWIIPLNRNADWITWESQTPKNVYYGFIHGQDERISLPLIQQTWSNYQMDDFGALILSDTAIAPFNNSRMLYTLETPENDPMAYHGSVAGDPYTPLENGNPLFSPIWTYLIDFEPADLSVNANFKKEIYLSPNPCSEYLSISTSLEEYNYRIFDLQGAELQSGKVASKIEVMKLKPGAYFIELTDGRHQIVRKQFIKM